MSLQRPRHRVTVRVKRKSRRGIGLHGFFPFTEPSAQRLASGTLMSEACPRLCPNGAWLQGSGWSLSLSRPILDGTLVTAQRAGRVGLCLGLIGLDRLRKRAPRLVPPLADTALLPTCTELASRRQVAGFCLFLLTQLRSMMFWSVSGQSFLLW